jgi:hypothetical protein
MSQPAAKENASERERSNAINKITSAAQIEAIVMIDTTGMDMIVRIAMIIWIARTDRPHRRAVTLPFQAEYQPIRPPFRIWLKMSIPVLT